MTSRLLVPTVGLMDWQRLLCNPQKQWRKGRSAYELAVAWEAPVTRPAAFHGT